MRASSFNEYAQRIVGVIEDLLSSGQAVMADITNDQRSTLRGFIGGVLHFDDGAQLHFREFVDVSAAEPRLMYAYHYQDSAGNLLFRYDNAAHKPPLSQPEHRHAPAGVFAWHAPTFEDVIDEILG